MFFVFMTQHSPNRCKYQMERSRELLDNWGIMEIVQKAKGLWTFFAKQDSTKSREKYKPYRNSFENIKNISDLLIDSKRLYYFQSKGKTLGQLWKKSCIEKKSKKMYISWISAVGRQQNG